MTFRELNRKKNLYLRSLKAKAGKFLFERKNKNRFTPSQLKTFKKVLFLRNDDKIGDMIAQTMAFRELKKQLPKADLWVLAGENSAKVIENNRNLSNILFCRKKFFSVLRAGLKLRKERFDLYIDMDRENTFLTHMLLYLIKPRFAFGFNKTGFKAYNVTCALDFDKNHITAWHQAVFKALRLQKPAAEYDLFVPNSLKKEALKFLSSLPRAKANIALNAFASSKHRCLSALQIRQMAQSLPQYNFILIGPNEQAERLKEASACKNVFTAPKGDIFKSFAIIAITDLLITPDTAFVHAAAALGKKQICIYKESDKANQKIWAPVAGKSAIIQAPDEFSALPAEEIIKAALKALS